MLTGRSSRGRAGTVVAVLLLILGAAVRPAPAGAHISTMPPVATETPPRWPAPLDSSTAVPPLAASEGASDSTAAASGAGISKLLDELGAAARDLSAGRFSSAIEHLERVGPAAIWLFELAVLGSALLLSALLFLPCAMVAAVGASRRIGIELPRGRAAPEIEPVVRIPPDAAAVWRSPLGLRAAFLLCMADDAFGFVVALAASWWLGAPILLAFDLTSHAGAVAALMGTAGGNLGALALAALFYRWRGAGVRGAGLVPLPVSTIAALAVAAALPLLGMSFIHESAFQHLVGREPRSNMEPILHALLLPGASPGIFIVLILTVAIIGPVTEEFIYRGIVYRAFRDRTGVPIGLFLSGLLFAISHLEMDHVLALSVIGITFGWLTERSGSLVPAMAAHALYNGLSLGLYLLTHKG